MNSRFQPIESDGLIEGIDTFRCVPDDVLAEDQDEASTPHESWSPRSVPSPTFGDLVGQSAALLHVEDEIEVVAPTEASPASRCPFGKSQFR